MADLAAAVEPEEEGLERRDDIILNGRYKIIVSAPLKAFDTPTARAFRVEDLDRGGVGITSVSSLFARVNETSLPSRGWELEVLLDLRNPHLVRLIDIGTSEFGGPGEAALTAVLEYPQGGRLIAPEGAGPMPLREVKRRVVAPLCNVLGALHERNIIHRAIYPGNLFVGEKPGADVILGECVSSLAGQNLPLAFQPLERASAAPLGCGLGDSAADVFSLGVTLAALLAGRMPGADREPEDLLMARFAQGSLEALCGAARFPREIQRFLAGMLADDPAHRWTLANVRDWLAGRHVTIAEDRRVDKPKRVFSFAGTDYQNPVAIAEAFNRNLGEAVSVIQSGRLEKWMASDRDRLVAAETIIDLRERNASGSQKLSSDALVSRVCMMLDPKGPIRFKGMAVSIDAFGPLLAYAFIEGRQDIADNITAILDQGLPAAWIASVNDRRKEMAGATSYFIRLRQYIKNPKLSYGLERCLYDMNQSLRCLHPRIDPADSGDAASLLASLDANCSSDDGEPLWRDRHVVAFLAAQLHPASDGLLAGLSMPGRPQAMDTLIGLSLVALAQKKLDVPALPGLTRTAGSSLFDIIESYHSDTRRKALQSAIEQQLGEGDFMALLELLNNTELQEQDSGEYFAAQERYKRIGAEIVSLQTGHVEHRMKAARLGRKIAAWTAFMGLLAVSFMTFAGLGI